MRIPTEGRSFRCLCPHVSCLRYLSGKRIRKVFKVWCKCYFLDKIGKGKNEVNILGIKIFLPYIFYYTIFNRNFYLYITICIFLMHFGFADMINSDFHTHHLPYLY